MTNYNDLIGIPFKDGGTGTGGNNPGGYDCYGLAREVFRRHGIMLPEINISVMACKHVSQDNIDKGFANFCKRLDHPEVPCLVQIYSGNPQYANHLATYVGDGRIIHITMKSRVIIQRLTTIHAKKIEGFYRYVG